MVKNGFLKLKMEFWNNKQMVNALNGEHVVKHFSVSGHHWSLHLYLAEKSVDENRNRKTETDTIDETFNIKNR